MTNQPEKPHFDRIYTLSKQNKENAEDIKELKKAAKAAGVDVPVLMEAVKRALMDDEKKKEKREREDTADALLDALGPFADSELGAAAVRAAQ